MKMSNLSQRHQYAISLAVVDTLNAFPDIQLISLQHGACFSVPNLITAFQLQARFVAVAARYSFDEEDEDYALLWQEVIQFFADMQAEHYHHEVHYLTFSEIDEDVIELEQQGAPR